MSKQELKITAVEYLNTKLFVEGLKRGKHGIRFDLSLDNPAECARKMKMGLADIGLVPVAEIPELNPAFVFGEYCIGASGPVRTVKLFSHKPLQELKSVILDPHSRTSVKLLDVLAEKYWKKDLAFILGENDFEKNSYALDTGVLVIGDKVFAIENDYAYSYDLAAEWIAFTGSHFVFAAWVSRIDLDNNTIAEFNSILESGLLQIDNVVANWELRHKFNHVDIKEYLTKNISYSFDGKKKRGVESFLKMAGFTSVSLFYK
ncbi:MAG: menaquinone biosynthesis protein [Bacteroidota bacterium]|nr:menaquinone biosynthesis protein [Bacteroidota bacterium]